MDKIVAQELNRAVTEVLREYETGQVSARLEEQPDGSWKYIVTIPKLAKKPFKFQPLHYE